MFSAGAMDAMMENGIRYDGIIGVSAGALFGCNYKSHQKGRALRYNCMLKDEPRYMGLRSLFRTGNIVGADFAYHVVPFELDVFDTETFRNDPTEFWMVCTDIVKGEPVYHQMHEFTHHELDWMRASASMPVVSHPVELDGLTLLDGGVTDSIPLRQFQKMGYGRNVVVLTQPKGYFKTRSRILWAFRTFCRKYPKVYECMARRHDMYNEQLRFLKEEELKGNTLVIAPDEPLGIGRTELNEKKMRSTHAKGYNMTVARMDEIRQFLASR